MLGWRVRCRTRTATVRVSDVQSVYKNTFFDYKDCTDMDFIVGAVRRLKGRSALT